MTETACISPGIYLRKRREAAGLSIEAVAGELALVGNSTFDETVRASGGYAGLLAKLEQDETADLRPVDLQLLVEQLELIIRFDRFVYFAFVAFQSHPSTPLPPICRVCACSWHDACVDRTGPCAWVNAGSGELPLCSHCLAREPGPSEVGPATATNDRETRDAA